MRTKGSKNKVKLPTSYEMGCPAINFYLGILRQAKADNAQMWVDFQKTELYTAGIKGKIDALETAWWICKYLEGK